MKINAETLFKKYKSSVIFGAVCVALTLLVLFFPYKKQDSNLTNLSEYSSVNAICELATLKGYYHNVVVYEEEPGIGEKILNDVVLWPFGKLTKIGYKQFWMEYSGIVELGVDASQIQINAPKANGVVDVYVPDARIMSIYADENTLTEPLTEKGLFTSISGKEKAQAFASAQNAMRQEAENDQALLRKAKENAKQVIKQYIINTGKEMGKEYYVNWIDNSI